MSDAVSPEELAEVMSSLGMSADDADQFQEVINGNLMAAISGQDIPLPEPTPVHREWHYPDPQDNALGAWYVRTDLRNTAPAASQGKLAGKRIAVKDNLLLAGVPLMNGTSILEGYTPNVDAEIITRILDEGATITGKSVCEAYCFSGGSHTASSGLVRNPRKPSHSAGGSSSGSAALVAAGEVDMAIGCDQGGSIRMPASFSGIVGMKPTWGLVPYTGILGMNPKIDHTGPMTADVADNALLLEVLAGRDGQDSRQIDVPFEPVSYTDALHAADLQGLRIGIVAQGFGLPISEADVDESVRNAALRLGELGAQVTDISIPEQAWSGAVTMAAIQGVTTSMFNLDGALIERPDAVPLGFVEKQRHWRERADELPANVKAVLISSEIIRRRYGYTLLARATAVLASIRAAYDKVLEDVDVLVMPTTAMKATPLPDTNASPETVTGLAFGPLANTSMFNNTHHPAISIPCGTSDGLPIGMMLVGKHFDEKTLYRVAHLAEQQMA